MLIKKTCKRKKTTTRRMWVNFDIKKPEEDEIKKIIIKNDPKQNKLQLKE